MYKIIETIKIIVFFFIYIYMGVCVCIYVTRFLNVKLEMYQHETKSSFNHLLFFI